MNELKHDTILQTHTHTHTQIVQRDKEDKMREKHKELNAKRDRHESLMVRDVNLHPLWDGKKKRPDIDCEVKVFGRYERLK